MRSDYKIGDREYLIGGFRDNRLALRMLSMGIRPGQAVRILGKSPFGSSYYVMAEGQMVALRGTELDAMDLKEVQQKG